MDSGGALQRSEISTGIHATTAPIVPEVPVGVVDILKGRNFSGLELMPVGLRNFYKERSPVVVQKQRSAGIGFRNVVEATIGLMDVVRTNIEASLFGDDC